MATAKISNCVWCETSVRADAKFCLECGLESPVLKVEAAAQGMRRKRKIGGRGLALAVVAVPLMLSAAYAARVSNVGDAITAPAAKLAAAAPATLADPLQRSVWTDGVKSVQTALNSPNFEQFANSFVSVSDGRVVSFCGAVPSSNLGQQRFVSVFGQRYSTVLEGNDSSFDVLWNRVCANPVKQA
ncbi:hypothetical protein ACELLULO517_16170 [Acidisoma cellulosilytica]|uniref:Uncharacterized protein n=1 Tax=Acidisoma cellulosilyticum TaxID=2802395 RepID=A0A963Z2W7_9PROT|nr:hypothetical protein [Acidisoma cellulosilyticum]MCB8881785.1 hypothetical protein [Acidisoma cellulosilyticum]